MIEECQAAIEKLYRFISEKPEDVEQEVSAGSEIPKGYRHSTLVSLAGTMRKRGMSVDAIDQALWTENVARCKPPYDRQHVWKIAESAGKWPVSESVVRVSQPLEWQEPVELGSDLPPVAPFCEELLPDRLRPLVCDIARRMQVSLDFPAVGTVASLYGSINRRCKIQPKAKDTSWTVIPNLWGAIIASPGLLKSPLIAASLRPMKAIEDGWRKSFKEQETLYKKDLALYKINEAVWKDNAKAAAKRGVDIPDMPIPPDLPVCRRNILNDGTFEAIHAAMNKNPAGIFLVRDELTGWLSQMDKPGREGERPFFLEAWNGDSGYTVDRIGRGTIHVDACCLSVFGGIQPTRLRSYINDAVRDGPANDGLIQRFQLIVWPDVPKDWEYVDQPPNLEAEEIIEEVLVRFLSLDASNPRVYRFAPDAQELFVDWLSKLESKVRGDDLHPALIAHLSKYRSLMPSLAVIFELSDYVCGTGSGSIVSLANAGKAAAWCEYLESHAKRVYSCIVTPQLRLARELAEKIKKRKLDPIFSVRDVYLKGWTGLDSPEAVRQAVELLIEASWIRPYIEDQNANGGRPSEQYEINPAVPQ